VRSRRDKNILTAHDGRSIDVGQFCVTDLLMLVILASLTIFIVSRRDYGSRFWLGMGIAAIGISLWALARIQLGSSFSVSPQARRLVTTGLYSKFRNPIYLFGGVGIVGLLVALGNWMVLAIFIALNSVQISRAKKEAKALEATFADEYRRYRARTWF
jgi:protein-S-isoprenylcysteine O-methyltransferase Ste14